MTSDTAGAMDSFDDARGPSKDESTMDGSDGSLPIVQHVVEDGDVGQELTADEPDESEGEDEREAEGDLEAEELNDPEAIDFQASQAIAAALTEARTLLAAASAEVGQARRRRTRLLEKRRRTLKLLDEIERTRTSLDFAQEDLNKWRTARAGSFAWKLSVALGRQRELLEQDYRELSSALDEPVSIEMETPSKLQDRFMHSMIGWMAVFAAVFGVVTFLKYRVAELAEFQSPINPFSWPTYVLALFLVLAFVVVWLMGTIRLYRAMSQRRFLLRRARGRIEVLDETARKMRIERQRMEALHAQVPNYLKFLSEILHRPWQTPVLVTSGGSGSDDEISTPEEIVFGSERPDPHFFPHLMRVAETPPQGGGPNEAYLVRNTLRRFLDRGWRFGSLADLLEAVGEALALPAGSLDAQRIDRDPQLRQTVMDALELTDARLIAGRKRLRSLARVIQGGAMEEVRPIVKDIAPDPLLELQTDTDLLAGDGSGARDWDAFLAEALGEPAGWGSVAFSLTGRREMASGQMQLPESSAYGADRLRTLTHRQVRFHAIGAQSTRPIDLAVRVDVFGRRVGPELIDVFESVTTQAGESLAEESSPIDQDTSDSSFDAKGGPGASPGTLGEGPGIRPNF